MPAKKRASTPPKKTASEEKPEVKKAAPEKKPEVKKAAPKKAAANEPVEVAGTTFVKVDAKGRKVFSDNLMPGERKLNDTTTRYQANIPTTD